MVPKKAYKTVASHKRKDEGFSGVIKRLAPSPIKTFGELEKYLQHLEGPLFSDMPALRRVKATKREANARQVPRKSARSGLAMERAKLRKHLYKTKAL
jgi:hypothetical protein